MQNFRNSNRDFDTAHGRWQRDVKSALRGGNLDSLIQKTLDGLLRGPLMSYRDHAKNPGAPGQFPFLRSQAEQLDPHQPWDMRSEVLLDTPQNTNIQILEALEGGANSIQLQTGSVTIDLHNLKQLLKGVDLSLAGIGLSDSLDTAQALRDLWMDAPTDLSQVRGNFGLELQGDEAQIAASIKLCQWAAEHAPKLRTFTIGPYHIHEAGGSEALELAWMCAQGAQIMRKLLDDGMTANAAAGQMLAVFSMDADLHLGIAKLRAARQVWAQMMAAFGVDTAHCALTVHSRSSRRMMSIFDPWVNILRTSTAALASILGGAQIISVLPFTHRLGKPSKMARRLARNTQLILAEECYAARVIDPAGGSHFHETMSQQLAQAGWQLFQQIEVQGGLQTSQKNGWLSKQVEKTRKARIQQIRTTKRSLIGINMFADLHETVPQTHGPNPDKQDNIHFSQFYDGAEFEQIRQRSKRFVKPPQAFLASLGSLAQSAPRTSFTRRFLATGGIDSIGGKAWNDPNAMLAEFDGRAAPLVVICGADDQYRGDMDELAKQFKAKGAKQVWIAGGPKQTCFDGRIALGEDMIQALQSMLLSWEGQNE